MTEREVKHPVAHAELQGRILVNKQIFAQELRQRPQEFLHPIIKMAVENPYDIPVEAQLDVFARQFLYKAKDTIGNFDRRSTKELAAQRLQEAIWLTESRMALLAGQEDPTPQLSQELMRRVVALGNPHRQREIIQTYKDKIHRLPVELEQELWEKALNTSHPKSVESLANALAILEERRPLPLKKKLDVIAALQVSEAKRNFPAPNLVTAHAFIAARYAIYQAQEMRMRTA